jgi:hypothetical protein
MTNEDDELNNYLNELESHGVQQFGGANPFYRTTRVNIKTNELYNVTEKTINIELSNEQMDFFKANKSVDDLFNHIYDEHIKNCPENLKVQVVCFLPGFFGKPVSTKFIAKSQMSPAVILKIVDRAVQSKKPVDFDNIETTTKMKIVVSFAKIIQGGAPKRPREDDDFDESIIDLEDYCNANRFISVMANDRLCLVRAIVIAKAHVDKEKNAKNLKKNPRKLKERVDKIVHDLDLPRDVDLNLNHVRQIEDYLQEYSIVVYTGGSRNQTPIYFNRENIKKKFIYILHRDDHFDALLKIKAFFKVKYFCDVCQIKYCHLGQHKCKLTCKACHRANCEMVESELCICGIETRNHICKDRHLETVCFKKKICNKCNTLRRGIHHVCKGEKYCMNCKKVEKYDHKCYILTHDQIELRDKNKKKRPFRGFIFFDFECYVDPITGFHVVNLAMAQRVCRDCIDKETRCFECVKRIVYYNISDFVDFMLRKKNEYYIFIAHNAKGYDSQFIINEFQKRNIPTDGNKEISATLDGTKLMGLFYRKICIKDSSLFIAVKLEDFPTAFGLRELKKGFFPHAFNKPENYVGPFPPKEDYGYNLFSAKKRSEFLEWYDEQRDKVFDFESELRNYCWSDVTLLTEGCLAYSRANRFSSTREGRDEGECPFREMLTLASYCNLIYRRNFMPQDSISMLPTCGFNPKANMSRKCDLWLKYLSQKQNIQIKHAKNGGEQKIGSFYVDGFCEERKLIFEFQGCLWHGCDTCYAEGTFNPIKRRLNSSLFEQTRVRLEKIKAELPEYEIIQMWEHNWDHLCKTNASVMTFVKEYGGEAPLYPRDALRGGRTNAIKTYHRCAPGEKIRYIDFTSLYPYVMKYGRYPLGHPTMITENFDPSKKYFGLIKCKILAPRGLYMPILPYSCNGKLMFTLCRSCSEKQNQNKCVHSDEQRAFVGSFVTMEVDRAVQQGYRILQTIEVWHFNEWAEYDRCTKSGGLFTDYLNAALKRKQEASGYPQGCDTEQARDEYIQDYYENEGIRLEKSKIAKNKGQRLVAKLWANTLWGYFALNTNRSQFRIIKSPAEGKIKFRTHYGKIQYTIKNTL